jgi:hypothetical protein
LADSRLHQNNPQKALTAQDRASGRSGATGARPDCLLTIDMLFLQAGPPSILILDHAGDRTPTGFIRKIYFHYLSKFYTHKIVPTNILARPMHHTHCHRTGGTKRLT